MVRGTVKWFSDQRGYGFIASSVRLMYESEYSKETLVQAVARPLNATQNDLVLGFGPFGISACGQ